MNRTTRFLIQFLKPGFMYRISSLLLIFSLLLFSSCKSGVQDSENHLPLGNDAKVALMILGTIQDGGSPHIGCDSDCCADLFETPDKDRKVTSIGIVDFENNKKYLFDATPDITEQMKMLKNFADPASSETPDAIFLTHAHIGHYTGLMYLGKEAMNSDNVPLFAMPGMKKFLENNGPWDMLVDNQNIKITELQNSRGVKLTDNVKVTPFLVPHRDEYSETVGYKISGPNKKVLFIPDIDKWEKWDRDIKEEIGKVDYAIVDATFYSGEELNTRDISQIPHPFIIESMAEFEELPQNEKEKVIFIHFNHTNPVINPESPEAKEVMNRGFRLAQINDVLEL